MFFKEKGRDSVCVFVIDGFFIEKMKDVRTLLQLEGSCEYVCWILALLKLREMWRPVFF